MDVILIELFLWAGLIFFFWALKDGLSHVESDIEDLGLLRAHIAKQASGSRGYDQPDKLMEAIGSYQGVPIYRLAMIGGQPYQFDHILTSPGENFPRDGRRFVAPGLVYVPVSERNSEYS